MTYSDVVVTRAHGWLSKAEEPLLLGLSPLRPLPRRAGSLMSRQSTRVVGRLVLKLSPPCTTRLLRAESVGGFFFCFVSKPALQRMRLFIKMETMISVYLLRILCFVLANIVSYNEFLGYLIAVVRLEATKCYA